MIFLHTWSDEGGGGQDSEKERQRQRGRQVGTEKVKVWQQDLALGLYLVIYVVLARCPHVFLLELIHIYESTQKSMFVLVCKNRVGVSGFGF